MPAGAVGGAPAPPGRRTPSSEVVLAFARRIARWANSADGRAVAVLVALPLVLFVIPAAAGHPAVTGDNLIQNFPLRVLSGDQLRAGHLPLWNPYIWSGSPLLGGLNAGSLYPFTLVFAVLAPVASWVVNLLGVYWAAGLGMYALARQYGLGSLACLLGALTYAFGGAMSGQIVHLGVVEGLGWIPLLVLAELRLSWAVLGTGPARARARGQVGDAGEVAPRRSEEAAPRRSPWPWVALLAAVVGLEALTGEPRAMAETEVVGTFVALWLVLRPYGGAVGARRRLAMAGYGVVAGAWGVLLAAAELAPGWSFIQASQRAVENYWFFGSGSMRPVQSVLLLVPDIFGGAGHFAQPRFFVGYNINELTGYVGLLPLAAALVLVSRSFGRRRRPMSSDWGMWLALGVLGLLLAWGSFTPLGHIWAQIPLFGKTRLQSRNIAIVDLALAMLLAFWVDDLVVRGDAADGTRGWRRWLTLAPPILAVVVCAVALAAPGAFEEAYGATASGAAQARGLWPWFAAEAVIAAAIAAVVLRWRRLAPRARRRALAAVVVADLVLFVLATSTAVAPPSATLSPRQSTAAAVLGRQGRFAIVDTGDSHITTLSVLGQPDLNVITELPSVQGYGSILSETYGTATGTHSLDSLDGCALADGVFTQLRLSTLLAYPGDLVTALGPTASPSPPPSTARCVGSPAPGSATRRRFYLGWPVTLSSATLAAAGGSRPGGSLRLGIVTPSGATRWPRESVSYGLHGWRVAFARPVQAVGIVVAGPARAVGESSTVSSVQGGRWELDGILQVSLDSSQWRFVGTWDGAFGEFAARHVRPAVWLGGSSSAADGSSAGSARLVSTTDWGEAVVHVTARHPVTLVWSEAYLQGWHAELVAAGGGASRSATVERHGLVQAVRVPAGTWTVTFLYRAPHLTLGLAGSALALCAFVALGAVAVSRRRRGHHGARRDWAPPAGSASR